MPAHGELRFAGKVALAPILIGPLNVEVACGLSWREALALAKRCGVRVAQSGEKRRRANEAKSAGGKKGGAIAGRGRPKAPASREAEPFLEGLMPEQKRNVVLEVQHGVCVRGDDPATAAARATDLARDYLAENQAKTATAIAAARQADVLAGDGGAYGA